MTSGGDFRIALFSHCIKPTPRACLGYRFLLTTSSCAIARDASGFTWFQGAADGTSDCDVGPTSGCYLLTKRLGVKGGTGKVEISADDGKTWIPYIESKCTKVEPARKK